MHIGSLTVRFDLSDYKLLVIGRVQSDSFGVTIAQLSYKYGLLRTNQIQDSTQSYYHYLSGTQQI